jgi:hypothetical protein
MVQHFESMDSFGYRTIFLSPLRFIRFCGQNAILFFTTNLDELTQHGGVQLVVCRLRQFIPAAASWSAMLFSQSPPGVLAAFDVRSRVR